MDDVRLPGRARLLLPTLLGLVAFAATSCAEHAPQDALEPEGRVARIIEELSNPVFLIAAVIFFLVEGLIIVALIRFRERPGDERIPRQVHGNKRLEIAWTLVPALILAGVAVPTVGTIWNLAKRPTANVLDVSVTANKWWWDVTYPGLRINTANEIHIPVGRPVYLTLRSTDVIHSFWVPKLAGKQDMVPGREHNITIRADRPGIYLGQCAEFCGLSHANMRFRVMADTPAEFDEWVAGQRQDAVQPTEGLAAEGARIFANSPCIGCHTVQGVENAVGRLGPNLTHYGSRSTFAGSTFRNIPAYLRPWLDNPPRMKPGARMPDYGLSREEIEALVAYMMSLK